MIDDFEHDLARAFLADGEARPDLVEAALSLDAANQARRRVVMMAASLAGGAIAAGMIGASGLLGRVSLPAAEEVWASLSNPMAVCALGAALLILAAGRSLLQDV